MTDYTGEALCRPGIMPLRRLERPGDTFVLGEQADACNAAQLVVFAMASKAVRPDRCAVARGSY